MSAPARRELVRHLSEHWLMTLSQVKALSGWWQREYNEERPKAALGGLTPAAYAQQLARKAGNLTPDSKAACY